MFMAVVRDHHLIPDCHGADGLTFVRRRLIVRGFVSDFVTVRVMARRGRTALFPAVETFQNCSLRFLEETTT